MNRKITATASIFILALLTSATVHAQTFKGKNFVNAGIGVGAFGFSGTGGLPLVASFEHGFTDNISAGAYIGFVKRNFAYNYKYTYFDAGVRGSYHFSKLLNVQNEKLDVYGGLSAYYRGYKLKFDDSYFDEYFDHSGSSIGVAVHAAARYMFKENLGAYAELGYGISLLQLGASFKF